VNPAENKKRLTTAASAPVPDNQNTVTAGIQPRHRGSGHRLLSRYDVVGAPFCLRGRTTLPPVRQPPPDPGTIPWPERTWPPSTPLVRAFSNFDRGRRIPQRGGWTLPPGICKTVLADHQQPRGWHSRHCWPLPHRQRLWRWRVQKGDRGLPM